MAGNLSLDAARGGGSPLCGAAAREWEPPAAPRMVVDVARRRGVAVLADLPAAGSCHWDLSASPGTGYWEPGGGSDRVRVTASGWVDAVVWRECGGLAGVGPRGFAQGRHGDGMEPGPLLGVLVEQAVTGLPRLLPAPGQVLGQDGAAAAGAVAAGIGDLGPDAVEAAASSVTAGAGTLAGIPGVPGADGVRDLSGDELLGAVAAAQRQQNRADWQKYSLLAEFTRRRQAEQEAAAGRGDAPGQRAGEFAGEEIAWALGLSSRQGDDEADLACAVAVRLPGMMNRMAEGLLGSRQALIVHRNTCELSDGNARLADAILAAEAPGLTDDALGRRAWRVTLMLDPDAADKRKKRGKKKARVQMWREDSGNAAFAGRELDPRDALAANSYIDAVARMLKKSGVDGTLRELRVMVFTDVNTGKDPLDRIPGRATGGAADACAGDGDEDALPEGYRDDGYRDDEPPDGNDDGTGGNGGGPGPSGPGQPQGPGGGTQAPVPASIHIFVSADTLNGLSDTPGEVSKLGTLDARSVRDLVRAASLHARTRWCLTVTDPGTGEAVAHGCARGQHPWQPPPPPPAASRAGPGGQRAVLAALLRDLDVTLEPIAKGPCDHRHREEHYTPSRKLAHLVRARTATCPAPCCGARAERGDLDHTTPWPAGPTDECNFGPPCRHHHRVKQAPGWQLDQPEPGVMRWTTPSGRVYTTYPTVYDF